MTRILNVPYTTHTVLLGQILNTCHISFQLVNIFRKYVDSMLISQNLLKRHCIRRAISSVHNIGRNIARLRDKYGIYVRDVSNAHVLKPRRYPWYYPVTSDYAAMIK